MILRGKITGFLLVREIDFSGVSKKWRLQLHSLAKGPCLWLLRSRVALARIHVGITRTSWWRVAHSANVPSCEWTIGPAQPTTWDPKPNNGQEQRWNSHHLKNRSWHPSTGCSLENLLRCTLASLCILFIWTEAAACKREDLRAWSINKPSHQGSTRLLGTSSIRPPSRSTVAIPGWTNYSGVDMWEDNTDTKRQTEVSKLGHISRSPSFADLSEHDD